jgi:hypothetical protein
VDRGRWYRGCDESRDERNDGMAPGHVCFGFFGAGLAGAPGASPIRSIDTSLPSTKW